MKPLRNTVWHSSDPEAPGLPAYFRILETYPNQDLAILFEIKPKTNRLVRPKPFRLSALSMNIHQGLVVSHPFQNPSFLTFGEDELPEDWRTQRDQHYELLRPLVEDPLFLPRLTETSRCPDIVLRAQATKVQPSVVQRLLNRYWRYGQTPAALIPLYGNCGSRGRQRSATTKKRGRPCKVSQFGFEFPKGINIGEADKAKIRAGISEHYRTGRDFRKTAIYATVREQYADEILLAEQSGRPAEIPTLHQFYYWLPLLADQIALDKQRLGENFWDKDHRALLGSVSENVHAPGDCFEIDSTIADVYIVAEFDRNRILGRPIIYIIVDEASRMVVGLHVSIYWASWAEAKIALLNAFLPKPEQCAPYDLSITEDEWPCAHLPRRLLVDRAELLGETAAAHTAVLGVQVDVARAFRGDWKAIVERRFGIANEESLHNLRGTTRGQLRKRGEPNPRDEAFYTLKEITTLLLQLFIDFNKTKQLDCLITRGLVEDNLAPTPLNFWNWSIAHHRDSLSELDPDQARAELLPPTTATVTRRGLHCDSLYYTCDEAEREQWFVRAGKDGSWILSARKDPNNSSILWIRAAPNRRLIKCRLLKRDSLYADLPLADVIYLQEWKDFKATSPNELAAKVRYSHRKAAIDECATKEHRRSGSARPPKTQDLRANRRAEQERLERQNRQPPATPPATPSNGPAPDERILVLIREVCKDDDPPS